jgi:hypothetical protein
MEKIYPEAEARVPREVLVRELYLAGASYADIASTLGIPEGSIGHVVAKYNLPRRLWRHNEASELRHCPRCKQLLPKDAFSPSQWCEPGRPCRECMRIQTQEAKPEVKARRRQRLSVNRARYNTNRRKRQSDPVYWSEHIEPKQRRYRIRRKRRLAADADFAANARVRAREYARRRAIRRKELGGAFAGYYAARTALDIRQQVFEHRGLVAEATAIQARLVALDRQWQDWLSEFAKKPNVTQAFILKALTKFKSKSGVGHE